MARAEGKPLIAFVGVFVFCSCSFTSSPRLVGDTCVGGVGAWVTGASGAQVGACVVCGRSKKRDACSRVFHVSIAGNVMRS